jgi:serine/threonine-protein kinase
MLAVMAGVGFFVFNRAVMGGESVSVPDLQSITFAEAQIRLAEEGLSMGTPRTMVSEVVKPNLILAQNPEPGRVVREGRQVFLTVSKGPEARKVPDLLGQKLAAAKQKVLQDGLKEAPHARMPHSAPYDTVIAQDPAPGHSTISGEVHLLISDGSFSGLVMPNLVGLKLSEVAAELSRLGLQGQPIQVRRLDAPVDEVIEQRPLPGSLITPGIVVEYEIQASAPERAPEMLREVQVTYAVPEGPMIRLVWVQGIDKDGQSSILIKEQEVRSGSHFNFPFRFAEVATVIFYVDGVKHQSYYYEGSADPIVTNHDTEEELISARS